MAMVQQRDGQLRQIVELSRQMLDLARATRWDDLADLERHRRRLVLDCFRDPAADEERPMVEQTIREILRINDQISSLGRDCMARLGGEIRAGKVRHNVSNAYLSHAHR